MKFDRFFKGCAILTLLMCSTMEASGMEVLVRNIDGVEFLFDIDPETPFLTVIDQIHQSFDVQADGSSKTEAVPCLDFRLPSYSYKAANQDKKNWRNYDLELTKEEKETIYYIIFTLGTKDLIKIFKEKSALKKAGTKLHHLHPLKFLYVIFSNEDLKAAMANLKDREWVWSEFKKGLYVSLTEEAKNNNLTEKQIKDFTKSIGITPEIITPAIKQGDWDKLVTLLIKNVPREGNPDRYDM
jgi:hypothetical protein